MPRATKEEEELYFRDNPTQAAMDSDRSGEALDASREPPEDDTDYSQFDSTSGNADQSLAPSEADLTEALTDKMARAPLRQPDEQPARLAEDAAAESRPTIAGWTPEAPKRNLPEGYGFMAGFSGDPHMQAAVQREMERPEREAQQKRLDQKAQLERDVLTGKSQKLGLENQALKFKADDNAPTSEASKTARTMGAQRLRMAAARVKTASPDIAKMMEDAASGFEANNQITARTVFSVLDRFKGVDDRIVSDVANAAKQSTADRMAQAKIGDMDEKNKQAWARIEAARQRALNPRGPSERVKAQMAKDQDKLDKEIEDADWARNNLLEIARLKKSVNTGPIAGRVQNVGQDLGLSSQEFDSMKQRLAMVSNRIIKELSGSAVTGNEWSRMQDELANIMNDDSNFETKLAAMIELTDTIKQRAINRYQRHDTGMTVDRSNTAARATAQPPALAPGEKPQPTRAAPAGGDQAAAAKAWLQANPNDPRAEQVRKRLQAMGAM